MKQFALCLVAFCFFGMQNGAYADSGDIELLKNQLLNESISYNDELALGESFSIDLSALDTNIRETYPNISLNYTWDIFGETQKEGKTLNTSFSEVGIKEIQLNLYATQSEEDTTLVLSYPLKVFVYSHAIAVAFDADQSSRYREQFQKRAAEKGILVHTIVMEKEQFLQESQIISTIEQYKRDSRVKSDYILLWGSKEFLFSTYGKIATHLDGENYIFVSSYNSNILKKYLQNALHNNDNESEKVIIQESDASRIFEDSYLFASVKEYFNSNGYQVTEVKERKTRAFLFLTRFIQKLSLNGLSASDIYIILLFPIFLTIVGLSKHVVGIPTMGNILPIFIGILMIKSGLLFVSGLILLLFFTNVGIGKVISKYNLLYTPKISMITIINIVIFAGAFLLCALYLPIDIHMHNVLYAILFFIVAEKAITIIISKEFREYSQGAVGTLMVSLICYMLFYIDGLRVFLMAFPEFLILLIPFNFFLGRFTGLRITEYIRFREVIKNVEE